MSPPPARPACPLPVARDINSPMQSVLQHRLPCPTQSWNRLLSRKDGQEAPTPPHTMAGSWASMAQAGGASAAPEPPGDAGGTGTAPRWGGHPDPWLPAWVAPLLKQHRWRACRPPWEQLQGPQRPQRSALRTANPVLPLFACLAILEVDPGSLPHPHPVLFLS